MAIAALNGVTVIELGEGISAPFCAKLLSDYGAEVIKIEKPVTGDSTRHFGPYPDDQPDPEKSGTFFVLNTNKKSVTLDIEEPHDREQLLQLVAGCDLLVENNPPAKMKSLGLDYDSLLKINPRLIMVSITPFGQSGPYSLWKGIDLNAFHLTAAGSRYCGRKGEPPLKHTTHSADYYGAYVATTWALASLFAQDRVGGEFIDVSCAEAIAASFVGGQNIGGYAQDGVFGMRTGVGMPLAAPATILPCQDGYVWMLALETGQWKGLVNAMGNPEWAQLDIFDNMFTRAQNADLIYTMMTEWTMAHTKQQIMDLCQTQQLPLHRRLHRGRCRHPSAPEGTRADCAARSPRYRPRTNPRCAGSLLAMPRQGQPDPRRCWVSIMPKFSVKNLAGNPKKNPLRQENLTFRCKASAWPILAGAGWGRWPDKP
jgi:crotonobetainyl-CoA:carnitine CoA-transferase CaiB-like acyl-CoA transferase